MNVKKISRENFEVILEEPTLYVDNKSRWRSGHMSHALAKLSEKSFIDFNSNCSAVRHAGHSAFGWIEYRLSTDSGKTYSDIFDLEYSKKCMLDGVYCLSVEKAIACNDGTIVAFCLRNSVYGDSIGCMPWVATTYIRSFDGVYILHGRAGGVKGFVLYTSTDAENFDEGTMLIDKKDAYCFYSNNLTLTDEKGEFMLIQYSDTYDESCRVNVWHQVLRIKKTDN